METLNNKRPLVSYFVFSYNQEKFICDAIKSALNQTYEPMEIIFSDDCSTDRTFEIIEREVDKYRGSKKIILRKNEENLGFAGNINEAFKIASGQFFIISAGDDISIPTRTEELVQRWLDKSDPVDYVSSLFENIDEKGELVPLSKTLMKENKIYLPDLSKPVYKWRVGATGACASFSRKLFDKYGPLDLRVIAEDSIFPFRAWLESGIAQIEKPLVLKRTHPDSIYVIQSNIKKIKSAKLRHLLREKTLLNRLARAKDWLKCWEISGKAKKNNRVETELKEWIQQLELECQTYRCNRLQALKAAIISLGYLRIDWKIPIRILIRHVLNFH